MFAYLDISDKRFSQSALIWLAEGAALGRLFQRRVLVGFGNQHIPAVCRTLRVVATFVSLDFLLFGDGRSGREN